MSRETCYRCFWPLRLCWCSSLKPMGTATRFVFLLHPKEFKNEKAATGRLTHLCLPNSEIHMGIAFDEHPAVQQLIQDPANFPVLLYPGPEACNVSEGKLPDLQGRRLTVFLLDATWALARKMLRLSPSLQHLPRLMFTPTAPSRYIIKQQPQEGCLSTLEATHELLLAMAQTGLDRYEHPEQLLDLFARMQAFQIKCANDPDLPSYRHRPYKDPSLRTAPQGKSGARRNYLKLPSPSVEPLLSE